MLTPKFEPEYLYRNNSEIKNQSEKAESRIPLFQSLLTDTQNLLNAELSQNQQIEILRDKWQCIENLLRDECPIENVVISKYIELKGLEGQIDRMKKEYSSLYFDESIYEFENGTVKVKDNYIDELEKKYTFYTENQKQNETLEILREWAGGFNKAFDADILRIDKNPTHLHHTNKYTHIKPFKDYLNLENDEVVPNYHYVSKVK